MNIKICRLIGKILIAGGIIVGGISLVRFAIKKHKLNEGRKATVEKYVSDEIQNHTNVFISNVNNEEIKEYIKTEKESALTLIQRCSEITDSWTYCNLIQQIYSEYFEHILERIFSEAGTD